MILNEREMQMAKELAREFTLLNQTNEEEEFERIVDMISSVKEFVTKAWNDIKEVVSNAMEFIESLKIKGDNHNCNWYVPIKIEAPPMPDIELRRHMNIRSNL